MVQYPPGDAGARWLKIRRGGAVRVRALILVLFLALVAAGCGEDDSQDEQYEPEPGAAEDGAPEEEPAPSQAEPEEALSEEGCLEEAAERGEAEVEIAEPEEVPLYEVVDEGESGEARTIEVETPAASSDELRAIAEDLRSENQEEDALSIDFFGDSGDGEERQDAGLALVFNTREAACQAFDFPVEEQDELIEESNGIAVVSVEEGV
jgi:hypothetical protein